MLAAHGLAEGRAAWAYSVNSLFDLARRQCRYEDIVNLRDHHRSHRDIIAFSNRHFYRGGLRIATDHESLNRPQGTGPAVRWVDMRGQVVRPAGGGALNTTEAAAVVAEVRKLSITEGYNGAIGVVTPFRAQANRIRTLVHQDQELSRQLASLQFGWIRSTDSRAMSATSSSSLRLCPRESAKARCDSSRVTATSSTWRLRGLARDWWWWATGKPRWTRVSATWPALRNTRANSPPRAGMP